MSQIVAGCMRINGRGPCKAVFDGMVSRQMERQNAEHRRDMESMEILRLVAVDGRAMERRRHLDSLHTFTRRERAMNRIMDGWGQMFGMLLAARDWCERRGLIERVDAA